MPLHKRTISGNVTETLAYTVDTADAYGAQVVDVRFYDGSGNPVAPTGGAYTAEWSANGKYYNAFEGTYFPAKVDQPVEDWQASGYVEHLRFVPNGVTGAITWEVEFRLHGIGMPGLTARTQSSNRYFSAVNTVQVDGFQQSILQGNALAASGRITVPANSTYSAKAINNSDAIVVFVEARGLVISFLDGEPTGDIVDAISGGKLNTLEPYLFNTSIQFYDGGATGERVVSAFDRLDTPVVINGGGAFELVNETNEAVTTYFSIGQVGISEPVIDLLLTPDTLIEPNTEMGNYNG